MKNKKLLKVISATLACALALGMAGCGEKKIENKEPEVAVDTIKWYNYGPQVREIKETFKEISKYTNEKLGINVECVSMPGGEYQQKMSLIYASREEFDMAFTANWLNFHQDAAKNCFMPLDDLLQAHAQDMLAIVPEDIFLSGTVNGKIYAVPAYKDHAYEYSFGYKIQRVEELGFDFETVNGIYDIEPLLKAYKEKYPQNYPLGIFTKTTLYPMLGYINLTSGAAVHIYDEENAKVINPWTTEESMEFFKKMHEWYKAGYILPDAATRTDLNGAGETIVTMSQMLPYQRMVDNQSRDPEMKMADRNFLEPWCIGGAGSMVAISQTSKKPEKTMQFINLLNTDFELRNMVGLGIEGKHWEPVGDKHFRYYGGGARDDMGYYSYPYTQGNVYLTRTLEGTPDDIWDKYIEFDERAIKAPNYGFTFDAEPVKNEVAAVNNVFSKYESTLYCGAVDPVEYVPMALEELEAAGIDKVIAEAQKQLDAFRANRN